ncbi:adenylate kinase [Prochlorococcus marinus]|uniref:Adenylate kinase n=1 Tax=Prochlorococcus marinus (strain MIT 9211) TaxID=93059 RepID=KAD_PROM4|nr:adenylate kinase [Prochlorococcus marinus]A9BCM8.1 RecName: Full=Adenylate kinase; Short=AK; AltName: Full=ATP-AMP transphosphorylase; AltName: Full=ATP:AMP phosphotransferase; AltName: Full=Adenylate monophosphate kinase [Prochlorococcus marinus str. MIT 9211]ABX09590.1 Adenylate kinase [Prochlorococcus marinus str. MIT 9211]
MKSRLLFLGPPGAGKGTQAKLLCENQGLIHLSTGDLLRAEVNAQSPLGKEAALIMNKGELVSDEIVLSIVQKRLSADAKSGWLLDGFPRNLIQAQSLQQLLENVSQPIQAVLLIELDDETLIKRLLSRGRSDDTQEVIRHRLEVYREKTAPLVDFYQSLGILVKIQGEGDVKDVALTIRSALGLVM